MRTLVMAVVCIAVLSGDVAVVQGSPTQVLIKAREFAYEPREVTVGRPGVVVFVVRNEGVIEHNFVIETAERRKVAAIANLKPGETEELEAGLRAGTYTFVCTLPGHRDAGMVGRLVVKP